MMLTTIAKLNKHTIYKSQSNSTTYIHPTVRYCKRLFDLCFAIIGILLLLPTLPLIALAIILDSKGPVFYQQLRAGKSQRTQSTNGNFIIFKFRSMYTDAEIDGKPHLAIKSDPRITRVGKFLRKTRLDETPQLINILRGEMSLIGPRPERPELASDIEKQQPFFTERTYGILPGLTGLAQINQSYLDSVNDIDAKLAYDHAYALTLSKPTAWLVTDISIFFKTILTVIKCNG